MTKKDYVAIGHAVKTANDEMASLYESHRSQIVSPHQLGLMFKAYKEHIVDHLADVFKEDNTRFDRERFVKFVNE